MNNLLCIILWRTNSRQILGLKITLTFVFKANVKVRPCLGWIEVKFNVLKPKNYIDTSVQI
jgi:hypothetical protein